MRYRLLDLGCGAGGASWGYERAGFEVTGVDINPQPRYPFRFIQADALTFPLEGFDAYHVSMPCHDHSPLSGLVGKDGTGWLLGALRRRLYSQDAPWVMENVPGAPMQVDLMLCGKMFGLRVKRHRWFEIDPLVPLWAIEHPRHDVPTATRRRRERWAQGWDVSITGDVGTYLGQEAMGIDWMTGNELSQAIPPAYTEFVGHQLLAYLQV